MGLYVKSLRSVYLPLDVVNKINDLELTKNQKRYTFKFIWSLIRDSNWSNDNIFSPVDRPFQYMEGNYTKHYYKWLKVLLDNQIVKRTPYSVNECFSYYINANMLDNLLPGLLCSPNFSNDLKEVTFYETINPKNQYQNWFEQDMSSLTLDKKEMENLFISRVNNVTEQTYKIKVVNELASGQYKLLSQDGKPEYKRLLSGEEINLRSKINDTSIIVTSKGVILDDLSHYFRRRMESITLYDFNTLNQLYLGHYNARRNPTNNRLDTNLTNLPSIYTDWICTKNNLIQIDLVNSQLCFLSKILQSTKGLKNIESFCELCYNGEIYTYIQNQLTLSTREEAKELMFTIIFSSNYTSKGKKEFNFLFPDVHKWITKYKKENGYKNLSITLQKMESNLFIDKIYVGLKKKGLFCLTKHDSLIIKSEDYNKIIKIINKQFSSFGLKGKLKVLKLDDVNYNLIN